MPSWCLRVFFALLSLALLPIAPRARAADEDTIVVGRGEAQVEACFPLPADRSWGEVY